MWRRSAHGVSAASGIDPQIRRETPDLGAVRCQTDVVAVPSEPSSDSVFVGRDREFGSIRSLLDRAAGGEAQALLVSGDAGVGKTALVARACSGLAGRTALFGACLPLTSMSIPFLPIGTALKGLERGAAAPPDFAGRAERDATSPFASTGCARQARSGKAGHPAGAASRGREPPRASGRTLRRRICIPCLRVRRGSRRGATRGG
jgi:hypothetical protein